MYFGGLFCIILKEDMFRKKNCMKSQFFKFSFFFMLSLAVSRLKLRCLTVHRATYISAE